MQDNGLAAMVQYFFQEYLPKHRGASPNTRKSYRDTIKLFLAWLVANSKPVDEKLFSSICSRDILDFLKHLEEDRSNTVATRNSRLAALKSFFAMCHILKPETKPALAVLQHIPSKKFDVPLIDFFEHDDVLKIFGTVDRSCESGVMDFLVLNLLYDTGMRASEVASVKLSGYDAIRGTLEIIGKGRKWRKITLWSRTIELLNDYLKNWRRAPKPLYQDVLIINRQRTALTRSGLHKICLKYINRAGIPKHLESAKRSPAHSWRHTAAVNMIRQGKSLLEVCVRLGHSSTETTEKYLHLDLTVQKERVDELVRFTETLMPPRPAIMSGVLKTTDEMVSFLKSI